MEAEEPIEKAPASVVNLCIGAAALGVIALVGELAGVYLMAVVFGALGLLIGGFAMSRAYRDGGMNKNVYVGIAAAGLLIAVIAFMLGFIDLVDGM